MKKLLLIAMATATLASCGDNIKQNPLVYPSETIYGTPEFSKIKFEHYEPAFDYALKEARKQTDAIINNPEAPTFENTIEAMERSGEILNRVVTIFFVLSGNETSPQMQELEIKLQPKLVEYSNDISMNPVLWQRVKTVYDNRANLSLNTEQSMLLEKTYKGFARSGANLSDADKETYRALSTELSNLTTVFGQNVLAATNAFTINITSSEEVAELPSFVREAMADEAKSRGREGYTVTLQTASMFPFLTYSTNRTYKEQLWRAYNTRCIGGSNDNTAAELRIAELRREIASLLGYPTYADYVLEERMAENISTVDGFLDELLGSTIKYARRDYSTVQKFAKSKGADYEIMPWDWAYWNEQYKNAKYSYNEEEVKPYFELENVKQGIFALAGRLYGISFKENPSIDVYQSDVKAYEVIDNDGSLLGVLYMDFFPRATKNGGAWMTAFREMSTTADGTEIRPLISLCGNFTKPTATTPSLLTFDEVETFLHEFGHCLHGLFAKGTYQSLTGTSVYRDFVELPSQIMENWATEPEWLDMVAVHYQTGEKMPKELRDKIIASKNYLAAYGNVRQLSFGITDMAFHTITAPVTEDPIVFEHRAMDPTQVLPVVDGTAMAPAFTHIFSGGYAAGYYSYKWAEVLEADAFSLFKQEGVFSREVAQSFRDNILSKGGTEHPMTLYVRFRGHKPETKALVDKILE